MVEGRRLKILKFHLGGQNFIFGALILEHVIFDGLERGEPAFGARVVNHVGEQQARWFRLRSTNALPS